MTHRPRAAAAAAAAPRVPHPGLAAALGGIHLDGCLDARPEYAWLEAQINSRHPQPRWARQLSKVDTEGLRFLRGPEDSEGGDK